MITKTLLMGCLFTLAVQWSVAQDEKREYEQSIKKRELPAEILRSVEPFLRDASRIRYYFETDGDKESYEIKGRIKEKDYSVELRKNGTPIDIEMLIDFEEIPEDARHSISEHLEQKYDKYVFTRLQQQYYPQEDEADESLEDFREKDFEDFEIRYELEVDTRAGNELGSFELLFDKDGKLLQKRKIERRAEDNIFY